MPTLLLKFEIILEDHNIRINRHSGPLFHEWLPNGEGDAICINIGANAELKIWFDRRGYVDEH